MKTNIDRENIKTEQLTGLSDYTIYICFLIIKTIGSSYEFFSNF